MRSRLLLAVLLVACGAPHAAEVTKPIPGVEPGPPFPQDSYVLARQ
jgi:hypothetical protein